MQRSDLLILLFLHADLLRADLLTDLVDKLLQRLHALVARIAASDGHGLILRLLRAHHKHVRHLGKSRLADLETDLLGAVIRSEERRVGKECRL